MADNASDAPSMQAPPLRPKSRGEMTASRCSLVNLKKIHINQGSALFRYSNLGYWRARRVIFYKNGDTYYPGIEFRFKPGRDIINMESLLDKLSLRMDLPRGARYVEMFTLRVRLLP